MKKRKTDNFKEKIRWKKHAMTTMAILTTGLFALTSLPGCGKTDKSQETQASESTQCSETTVGKPLTMAEKDRMLSLEELQKYSDKYTISCNIMDYEEGEILIDGYGNVDMARNVGNLYVQKICDLCSNEVLYYKESYVTKEEKEVEGEDYYETNGIPHSRLYDKEGNMLIDWQDIDYGDCCGDWILRSTYSLDSTFETPSNQRTIFNVKDGSTMEGAADIASIDSETVRIMDDEYNTVGFLDKEGDLHFKDLLQSMPDKNVSFFQKNGYYYTICWDDDSQKCTTTFFDVNENQVFSFEYNDYVDFYQANVVGPYIIQDTMNGDRVLDLRGDGNGGIKVLYEAGDITYYDGERIIADHNGDEQYGLFDADGNQLASFKGKIIPENVTADKLYFDLCNNLEKAETFLAIDGDTIKRIDCDGKELASFQVPITGINLMDIEIYEDGIYYTGDDFEHVGLLSKELEETVPCKQYINPYCTLDEATGVRYLYVGERENGVRNDSLYTMKGELVLSDVGKISSVRDGKASVMKGKYFGIVDLNGQWIYKYSLMDYMDFWM